MSVQYITSIPTGMHDGALMAWLEILPEANKYKSGKMDNFVQDCCTVK